MSTTRDLIAAALTLADIDEHVAEMPTQAATDVRELCARAMVQPDIGEVKNLVSAACNLMFDAGKLLGRRDAGADREVEDARSARTALLDYVRGVMAERDALLADNERLSGLYEQAVKGRADMRSALRDARAAAPQPVSATEVLMPPKCHPLHKLGQRLAELLDENQWAECERLLLECWKHEQKPSAAEVPMPQGYAERPADYSGGIWIESQMRQYGDAREAAGYAAGVAAGGKNSADDCSTCHYAAPTRHEQCSGCEQNVTMFINYKRASWAALRGEVKS